MSYLSQEFREDFSEKQICRLTAETFVEHVNYHTELDSTNTWALSLARDGADLGVTLILADRQTAGRGRGENQWWSAPGALTFSLLIPGGTLPLATADWPKASLVTGLAVGNALAGIGLSERALLKWPNDVFLQDRKVAGILVEGSSGQRGALVIGVGVNVNNSLAAAPADLVARAVSVCDVVGHEVSRVELLRAILVHLESRLAELASGESQWLDDWREKCLLTGCSVQIDTQNGPVAGTCRGLDDDGALLVETPDGERRCLSGVVTRFDVNRP